MFAGFTPTATSCVAISPTTSGADTTAGPPTPLTLMPTTSWALKNRAQLSRTSLSPVRVVMPRVIMARTVGASAVSVATSMHFGEWTVTTRPGYGPGMPGFGTGL